MYTYRSPLMDDEDSKRDVKVFTPTGPTFPSKALASSHPKSSSTPYSRPSSSNEAPKYSSRYQLSSYPKELNDMFGALECKLCAVQVTSPIVAKMHYSGKSHMKKVKQWFERWSLKTGNPLPKFDHNVSTTSMSLMPDYCELCDVKLLTTNDKMLHYAGRGHKMNEQDPANAKKKKKTYATIDLSGTRFGIGADFSSDSKAAITQGITQGSEFTCEPCGVKAQTQEQLDQHLGGKKHKDKLRKKESQGVPKPDRPYKCDFCNVSLASKYLYNLHCDGKAHAKVLKTLELEFKQASCEICGVVYSSFTDFYKHMTGKEHEMKRQQSASRPEVMKVKQETLTFGNECEISLDKVKTEPDKWTCGPCFDATFETEEEYEEHKETKRHLLCMLNVEGDKVVPEKIYFYCFTCRKQCNDRKDYLEHHFTQKHMTLSDPKCDLPITQGMWYCHVCDICMDQVTGREHQNSKHHLMLAAQQELTQKLMELATQDLGTNTFKCTHCDIDFVSFIAFTEHMLDPAHLELIVSPQVKVEC